MGQFWSIRRKSPLKVKELQKSKSVVRDNSQVFCSGEYEEKQKKADAPTLPSGYYLVRQRKIRGKIHNHLHSDLLISAVTDTNNNVTLGNKRHVTTTEGIKQSSANFSSGQESGLIKHLHNTYSNAGYNHSPTNDMLRTTTTTCQLPQNNYLEAKSIYSEATVQSEPIRRYHHHQHRHHHRHHRRKRNKAVQNHHHHHHHQQEQQSFGYDINNVDEFLSKVWFPRILRPWYDTYAESIKLQFLSVLTLITGEYPRCSLLFEYFVPNTSRLSTRNSSLTRNGR